MEHFNFLGAVRGGRQEGEESFRPQLTSLVDVMTILLVFLIKSFSVEGNLVTASEDLVLPLSTAQKPPSPQLTVEIARTHVSVDGRVVAQIADIENMDSLLIPALYDWMIMHSQRSGESKKSAEVLIQADRETPFESVKKVMYTCGRAGFSAFSVLVIQDE